MRVAIKATLLTPTFVRGCVYAVALMILATTAGRQISVAQSQNSGSEPKAEQASVLLDRLDPNACEANFDHDIGQARTSLAIYRGIQDISGQARATAVLGKLYASAGRYNLALPYLKQAVDLLHRTGDTRSEASVLDVLGDAYNHLADPKLATEALDKALDIYDHAGDRSGSAATLTTLGEVYASSDSDKAMHYFDKALELSTNAADLRTKGIVLIDEGTVYQPGDPEQALLLFKSAIALENQINDCRNKAAALANIASIYEDKGQPREALQSYSEALSLEQKLADESAVASISHAIAKTYEDLGDLPTALSLLNRALDTERRTGDLAAEGPTLSEIATVNRNMGKPASARRLYLQAVPMLQKTGDLNSLSLTLNNLGAVSADLGNPQLARRYYQLAIAEATRAKNPAIPAYSAWGIGSLEEADAASDYFRALHIAQETGQPDLEGRVDASLMNHFQHGKQNEVAIFFGKQAVERFQSIRRNMTGLSNDLISSFLQSKVQAYRSLAELLIEEGRLSEAQQILDLLKVQEYSDYIRGQPNDLGANPSRTSVERKFEDQYEKDNENIVALNKQLHTLETEGHSSPEKQAKYEQLQATLKKADRDFDEYLHNLYTGLKPAKDANEQITRIREVTSTLQDVIASKPHTVGIYTLIGDDHLRLIVITGSQMVWRSYPISKKVLEQKCFHFLDVLSHPQQSPEAAAKDLFSIIFGPIKKDIEQADGQTLIWYLDGTLRYIPVSALRDPATNRYLIQTYSVVNFTPLNLSLADVPNLTHASAIAMGTSRSYEDALGPLPNVKEELNEIVSDPNLPQSRGVLPGTILLDEKFTETAMEQQINTQSIVHIASHFLLKPGDDDLSYLLLAGKDQDAKGYHLSVSDFRNDRSLHIAGKELVTLSACQTAAASVAGDGFEMEGVSTAVLQKRAKAVISSLWEVNDQSTGVLMGDFYRQWIGSNGALTKAAALQKAQLDLLEGRIKPKAAMGIDGGPTNFTNPYYWAPFVLMGNWQ